jgi:ketosteroid isomerase-like protein
MRLIALVAVAVTAACGGGTPAPKVAKPTGPEVDPKTAETDAKGLLSEIYQTISRGKSDSLYTLLNPKLAVFGPRKGDALATREAALVALGTAVDPKAKSPAQVRGGSPEIVASPGGHSAWGYDAIDVHGSAMSVLAVLTNDDDIWLVTAASLAETPTMKQVRAELKKVAVVPPGAAAPGNIDPRAKDAVEHFQKGLLDQDVWGDDLASRTEAIVIGPAAGDVTRGKKEIKKLWKKRVAANTREATSGEVTAEVTADEQLAWVTAPVTMVADDEEPLPLRVFAVFEKSGDAWKMIALQEALAIDEPGAGAPFVKILPPAPKPPEPEKVAEVKKDDKPTKAESTKHKKKKAKKKKKKKVVVEDDE